MYDYSSVYDDRIENRLQNAIDGSTEDRIVSPRSRIEYQLQQLLNGGGSGGLSGKLPITVLGNGEFNPLTGVPTITGAQEDTFYLVPDGDGNNLYSEWIYHNGAWEHFGYGGGSGADSPVHEPHNYAFDGKDLSTIFADADELFDDYSVENYSKIHIGDYWPVTLNGTYRDYGQMTVPSGVAYYSDTALTDQAGTTDEPYAATPVQNTNVPGCHEDYCSFKIGSTTYYAAYNNCLDYLERTLSNAVMLFEVADINPYWRYGDAGSDNFVNGRPHLLLSSRDGLPHTLKMRKLNEVWEGQHVDTFTGDGETSEFTLSGTVGTIGYVYVSGTKKTYNTHYTYGSNKVTFKSGQIPASGAEIKIEWCEDISPWTGSALYRTFNDPDYGILKLIQSADAKLYNHIYKGPNSKGMRYGVETRTKTGAQGVSWADRGILFLPTEDEIWGRQIYAINNAWCNQQQWAIYRSGRRHFAKGAGNGASRSYVWTASSTGVTYFAYVTYTGYPNTASAAYALAAAPCFLLT